jgi:hypothetical protein
VYKRQILMLLTTAKQKHSVIPVWMGQTPSS